MDGERQDGYWASLTYPMRPSMYRPTHRPLIPYRPWIESTATLNQPRHNFATPHRFPQNSARPSLNPPVYNGPLASLRPVRFESPATAFPPAKRPKSEGQIPGAAVVAKDKAVPTQLTKIAAKNKIIASTAPKPLPNTKTLSKDSGTPSAQKQTADTGLKKKLDARKANSSEIQQRIRPQLSSIKQQWTHLKSEITGYRDLLVKEMANMANIWDQFISGFGDTFNDLNTDKRKLANENDALKEQMKELEEELEVKDNEKAVLTNEIVALKEKISTDANQLEQRDHDYARNELTETKVELGKALEKLKNIQGGLVEIVKTLIAGKQNLDVFLNKIDVSSRDITRDQMLAFYDSLEKDLSSAYNSMVRPPRK